MSEPDYDELSRAQWEAVAPGWKARADELEERGSGIAAAWMLDAVKPEPGERVLELACGAAGVGLQVARAVAPGGSVLLTDFSPAMVRAARERAAELAVDGVDFAEADAQALDLPDASFDAVICRFGYMLMGDPAAALRETSRVLRPAGRVALAVWAEPEANPWIVVPMRALMEHLGAPAPDLDAPGLWALRDPERLRGLLEDAGLRDIRLDRLEATLRFSTLDEAWDFLADLAGPLQALFGALSDDDRTAVRERVARDAEPYTAADGSVAMPGVINAAAASRPTT